MAQKILFLVVTNYPYDFGEPFLEMELKTIAHRFDKILIIIPESKDSKHFEEKYFIPQNAEIVKLDIRISFLDKLLLFKTLWDYNFWRELKIIKKQYGLALNISILKTIWSYCIKAQKFYQALRPIEKKYKPDLKYFYSYWLTEFTFSSIYFSKKNNWNKLISRVHGWDCYFERSNIGYLPFRQIIFENLDFILPVSENGRTYLLHKLGGEFEKKIQTCHLGTMSTDFIKTKISISHINLLSIAFLASVKQLDKMAEGISSVVDLNIHWHHIGSGSKEDQEKFICLVQEKFAGKNHLKFTFHGTKSPQEIYKFLASENIHALINTSKSEGLPVTFMEAMSFGIPVIAPNVGGISEIVKHEYNGWLMNDAFEAKEIASCISNLGKLTEEEYQRFRKNAYSTWQNNFNGQTNFSILADKFLKEN